MASTTRDNLIEVGLAIFQTEGYTATGISEIIERAGVHKGSFYHLFPSKEAFAIAVLQAYATAEMARWTEAFGETKLSPLKRLRKYLKLLVVLYGRSSGLSGCFLGSLCLEVADHSEDMRLQLQGVLAAWQGALAGLLQQAKDAGELRPSANPAELAELLIAHWEGAHVRAKAENSDHPLALFLRFTFDVLLRA
jgi:TetR/AcrR family transcriptional repressor of nem operon